MLRLNSSCSRSTALVVRAELRDGRLYVREEVLERQFADLLGRLTFDDEVLDWVREALRQSHADEKRDHEEAIARLQTQYDRLQNRLHAMYVDKLDGRIDTA